MSDLRIFTGQANPDLAKHIAASVGVELGRIKIRRFADGETSIKIEESARGMDVFLIQPTCQSVNTNLMELLIMIDAFRRASARRITAVMPYYGYARQDKKLKPREPITARLIANLITVAGAHRVLCVDLHAGQSALFLDAGIWRPAKLGDYVWEDLNGNGIQDSGEPGVVGVTVNLLVGGAVEATTTTGVGGIYSFASLAPGTYSVQVELPAGYAFTSQYSGADPAARRRSAHGP